MCLSEGISFKPVLTLKHATRTSTEQTSMKTKWFKHIAIQTVQELLLTWTRKETDRHINLYIGASPPHAWWRAQRLWGPLLLPGWLAARCKCLNVDTI